LGYVGTEALAAYSCPMKDRRPVWPYLVAGLSIVVVLLIGLYIWISLDWYRAENP